MMNEKEPYIVMLVGIPGSGKSMFANTYAMDEANLKIHSSDNLRYELFGDMEVQDKNGELFKELHRRIKEDLRNGINVIYDATNINKKKRIAFLSELNNISCQRICLCIMTPYDICLRNNQGRGRIVPEHVIRDMYMNWQPPYFDEGFDAINIAELGIDRSETSWHINDFIKMASNFDQQNEHHALTLGEHCMMAKQYTERLYPDNKLLHIAAELHDCGKPFTKTRLNKKHEFDGNYHYYNHHMVGAYDAMLYMMGDGGYTTLEILYVSNLIYYHMHPYREWVQSEKNKEKCRNNLGKGMFDDIMHLHDADVAAH